MPRVLPNEGLEIALTETESNLCTLLDECTTHLRVTHPELEPVECRIAGGWVRDKLLGLQSNDIDVALSTMMGVPFAAHLVSFLNEQKGQPTREAHKIASNPEQSKHLETANVHILGMDVDLVNLRSEEYAEGSRIPTSVGFGTPFQDALRRDITINALFYNVHTRTVEDFTGKGLDDLQAGIIRTPLSPRETFMDDPLRVLRCVRFASRFGYTLEENVKYAILDKDIQAALVAKVSRERVGIEVDKMIKGPDPLFSIQTIDELSLYSSIFWLPESILSALTSPPGSTHDSLTAARVLHAFLAPTKSRMALPAPHSALLSHVQGDSDVGRRLYLAAAMTPYKGRTYLEKKKVVSASEAILRVGLKIGNQNHYIDVIPSLFISSSLLANPMLNRFTSVLRPEFTEEQNERVAIGTLLRDKSIHNPSAGLHWEASVTFALVQEIVSNAADGSSGEVDLKKAAVIIENYDRFVSRVKELGLDGVVDDKPLLDGRTVLSLLGLKPGPQTGKILESVVEWQLAHPSSILGDADRVKACENWLKQEHTNGTIVGTKRPSPDAEVKPGGKKAKGKHT